MNGLPALLAQRRESTHSELDIVVRADNPWFEGHFPEQPILPGVVQIGWAVHFACAQYGFQPEVHTLEQIKFRRPILPDTELCLQLTPQPGTAKLRFEYRDASGSFSSGTLVFGAAP